MNNQVHDELSGGCFQAQGMAETKQDLGHNEAANKAGASRQAWLLPRRTLVLMVDVATLDKK